MPIQHLKHYARSDAEGVEFDIDAIAVDLVTLAKAANISEATFFWNMNRIWRDVTVEVTIKRPPGEELH